MAHIWKCTVHWYHLIIIHTNQCILQDSYGSLACSTIPRFRYGLIVVLFVIILYYSYRLLRTSHYLSINDIVGSIPESWLVAIHLQANGNEAFYVLSGKLNLEKRPKNRLYSGFLSRCQSKLIIIQHYRHGSEEYCETILLENFDTPHRAHHLSGILIMTTRKGVGEQILLQTNGLLCKHILLIRAQ